MPIHRRLLLLSAAALLATGCGGGGLPSKGEAPAGPPYAISSHVIMDRSTQHIQVWAPVATGPWPVVYAVPGVSGRRSDFDQVGPAVARQGAVFFATDYRADATDEQRAADLECGYRYARSVAKNYGGNTGLGVTAVGYSRGAQLVFGGLQDVYAPGGSDHTCLQGSSPPDSIVAIEGCYYAYQQLSFDFPVELLDNKTVPIFLVSGLQDDVCAPWQSQKASDALDAAGFDATLVTIPGANHYRPIFHDLVNGTWTTDPSDPAGQKTVETILGAMHRAG